MRPSSAPLAALDPDPVPTDPALMARDSDGANRAVAAEPTVPGPLSGARTAGDVSGHRPGPAVLPSRPRPPVRVASVMPGPPPGHEVAVSPFQRAYDRYLVRIHQKVDPLWEFPRELAVRMEQGEVLVGFTIQKDGSVKDVRVIKGSGFPKFDRNVVSAIQQAAPFDALPETLGSELRVTAPFVGSNPAIR
jgi:TonB family protein